MDINNLRKSLRNQRRQLSRQTLELHSILMAKQAMTYRPLQQGKRIAFYFASNGEMDPAPLVERASQASKQCYFPVLRSRPSTSLWFARYQDGQALKPNRFGIYEPATYHRQITMPWGIDLIIMPLVAFDLVGNRLGMGGGYYDRTLAFKNTRTHWKGPKLIGIAHEFQCVEALPANAWDIPLDAVITERKIYRFNIKSTSQA